MNFFKDLVYSQQKVLLYIFQKFLRETFKFDCLSILRQSDLIFEMPKNPPEKPTKTIIMAVIIFTKSKRRKYQLKLTLAIFSNNCNLFSSGSQIVILENPSEKVCRSIWLFLSENAGRFDYY